MLHVNSTTSCSRCSAWLTTVQITLPPSPNGPRVLALRHMQERRSTLKPACNPQHILHLLWHSPSSISSSTHPAHQGHQAGSPHPLPASAGWCAVWNRSKVCEKGAVGAVATPRHDALQTATQPHGTSLLNTAAQPTPAATPHKPLPRRRNAIDTRPKQYSKNGDRQTAGIRTVAFTHTLQVHTRSSALSMAPSAGCSSSCLSLVALARPRVPARAKSYSMFCRQQQHQRQHSPLSQEKGGSCSVRGDRLRGHCVWTTC